MGSITLQLDTNAVHSLFPEGSEAEVHLRNAVVAEVTRRTFAKNTEMPDDLAKAFTHAAQKHVDGMEKAMTAALHSHQVQLMKESQLGHFSAPDHWSRSTPIFSLSAEMKEKIALEVRHQFAVAYRAELELQLPAMLEKYLKPDAFTAYIDKRMKVLLDSEVGNRVTALLAVK